MGRRNVCFVFFLSATDVLRVGQNWQRKKLAWQKKYLLIQMLVASRVEWRTKWEDMDSDDSSIIENLDSQGD